MKAGTIDRIAKLLEDICCAREHEGAVTREEGFEWCSKKYDCIICRSRLLLICIHNEEDISISGY